MYQILIVDDEKIERRGIRFLLKKMGIELERFTKQQMEKKH